MIRRLLPFLIFAVLTFIFLWPVLFGARALLPGGMLGYMSPWRAGVATPDPVHWNALTWDSIAYFYPARKFLGESIKSGDIPFWNPYQMCGMPFLADPQTAVLYPPNLLFALLPADVAFGILAALHLFAAGVFTYIFLRGIGLSSMASMLGGITFMLGGFAVVWLELPNFLAVAIWLPLTLHFLRLALIHRSRIYAAVSGIMIALSLIAGHPQIAFYCLLVSAMFLAYLAFVGRSETGIVCSLGLGIFAFAIGFALAAPQILPTTELAALSHRIGGGYKAYSSTAMTPANLITLLLPDFYGNPSKLDFDYWGVGEYADYCGYMGILPLLLAPLAFMCGGKRRQYAWFFGCLAVLGLLMAMGTAVNRIFYFGVPGFSRSGSPVRALFIYMFSLTILGALGFERLLNQKPEKANQTLIRILLIVISILLIGLLLLKLNFERIRSEFGAIDLLEISLPVTWLFPPFFLGAFGLMVLLVSGKLNRTFCGGLLVGLLIADLLVFGIKYNQTCVRPQIYPEGTLTNFLRGDLGLWRIMPLNSRWDLRTYPKAVLPPNSAMVYGLQDVQGYSALYPLKYKKLLDAAAGRDSSPRENGNMVFAHNPTSPIYDLLGVRWIISLAHLGGKPLEMDGCYLYQNDGVLPRAFIVHKVEFVDDDECLRRIRRGEVDLRSTALGDSEFLLEALRPSLLKADMASEDVKITKYRPNEVTVSVRTRAPGILILTDQFYPGWEALVDGEPKRVFEVDFCFRGVAIQAGKHEVVFSYRPKSFKRGLWLACCALVVLLGVSVASIKRGNAGSEDG
ncbi:MAG: YfhO family protein [Armatimonadetes bacterium]|nr:YfhO family protein [Armatimonadota bacterium]